MARADASRWHLLSYEGPSADVQRADLELPPWLKSVTTLTVSASTETALRYRVPGLSAQKGTRTACSIWFDRFRVHGQPITSRHQLRFHLRPV
jgi:hypothetical protein